MGRGGLPVWLPVTVCALLISLSSSALAQTPPRADSDARRLRFISSCSRNFSHCVPMLAMRKPTIMGQNAGGAVWTR